MWIVYVLIAILVILLVALSIPVTGRIVYDGELKARVRVLGFSVVRSDGKQERRHRKIRKEKKEKRTKKDKPSKWQELKELLKQDDAAGTLHFVGGVARLAGRAVGRLLRAVTVTDLQLQMLIATGDPADTAQRYGQVCAVLYPAMELIAHRVRIRRRRVRIEPNFLLEKSCARFDVRFRVSVWRLLGAAIALLWGFLLLRNEDTMKEVS